MERRNHRPKKKPTFRRWASEAGMMKVQISSGSQRTTQPSGSRGQGLVLALALPSLKYVVCASDSIMLMTRNAPQLGATRRLGMVATETRLALAVIATTASWTSMVSVRQTKVLSLRAIRETLS